MVAIQVVKARVHWLEQPLNGRPKGTTWPIRNVPFPTTLSTLIPTRVLKDCP